MTTIEDVDNSRKLISPDVKLGIEDTSNRETGNSGKRDITTNIWSQLRLSELAAVIVGFLYVSGYYINSIFVRNLGIAPTELKSSFAKGPFVELLP